MSRLQAHNVACVSWPGATRTSVCVSDHKDNKQERGWISLGEYKGCRAVWMFLLTGFGGYSECPYMCSGSQSHDLLQMVERKKRGRPANQHTHSSSKSGVGRAWLMLYITTNHFKC